MEQNKPLTYKDILNEKTKFIATGVITDISGESNKTYKSGWTGSSAEITMMVDGRKQKIKIFGGVGKNEFKIRVFTAGADGQMVRDGNNKTIQTEIFAKDFNPNAHVTFDKREVIQWGERGADNKPQKIEVISELTDGRFADKLIASKSELIGRRVKVTGEINFKPTQKYDKLEANMSVKQIVLQDVVEGKEFSDRFFIETPLIVEKKTLTSASKDGFVTCFVPIYHKFDTPQIVEGRQQKGRNVFVPMNFTTTMNGFLGLPAEGYYDMDVRTNILVHKIETRSVGFELAMARTLLSYKSGMIERDITLEELSQDPIYSNLVNIVITMHDGEEKKNETAKLLNAYKLINPATVKGEFKQQIDYITVIQRGAGDMVAPIEKSCFEIMTLQKIGEELEARKNKTAPVQQQYTAPPVAQAKSANTSHVVEPVAFITGIDSFDNDDFPF
ncbi:MAG: hypothetical protein ACRCZ0_11895 [Cetobacterium sp.]